MWSTLDTNLNLKSEVVSYSGQIDYKKEFDGQVLKTEVNKVIIMFLKAVGFVTIFVACINDIDSVERSCIVTPRTANG